MQGLFRRSVAALAFAIALRTMPAAASLPPQTGVQPAPVLAFESIDDDAPLAGETADAAEIAEVAPEDMAATDLPTFIDQVAALNGVTLDRDMDCLARAIYFEARGESIEGQLAVAQVVLNRVASPRYAGSICDVVYAPKQFSFTSDGRPDVPARRDDAAWRRAEAIAIVAVTNSWADVTDDALYFHATYVAPSWRHAMEETRQIGRHIFYR